MAFDARVRQTDAFFLRYRHIDEVRDISWLAEGWYNRTFFSGDNLNPSKQGFYQTNPVFVPPRSFIGFTDADVTSTGFRVSRTVGCSDCGQLTAGIDLHSIEGELNEFDDFGGLGTFESFPIPRSQMTDIGLFAEMALPLLCESKVTIGARFDQVKTEQPAVYSSFDPIGVEHVFEFGSEFSERDYLYHGFVTADHPLGNCWTLRAGLGHGQRPPNLTERFAIDPFITLVQNATSAVIGDELLKPERATQMDVAMVGDYGCLRVELAGFWSHIDDHITLAPDLGISSDPDLRLLDFVNQDSVLAGAELLAEVDLTSSLMTFTKASFVDGRNLILDQPLPNIYPLQTRLGLMWHEPCEDRFGIEFAVLVVDNQDRIASALLEQATPGFSKIDIRGYWQATGAIRLTAGFENIGDRNYLEHLSVHNPRVLEPGFNFYLATQIDL